MSIIASVRNLFTSKRARLRSDLRDLATKQARGTFTDADTKRLAALAADAAATGLVEDSELVREVDAMARVIREADELRQHAAQAPALLDAVRLADAACAAAEAELPNIIARAHAHVHGLSAKAAEVRAALDAAELSARRLRMLELDHAEALDTKPAALDEHALVSGANVAATGDPDALAVEVDRETFARESARRGAVESAALSHAAREHHRAVEAWAQRRREGSTAAPPEFRAPRWCDIVKAGRIAEFEALAASPLTAGRVLA